MDVELREALTQGFGPEPAHRPVTDRLDAGHRAVRRRRIAGSVAAFAVATVAGLGAVAVVGDGATPSRVASDTGAHWEGSELARYNNDGELEINPDAKVVDRVDSPFPPSAGMDHSVALALEHEGEANWMLLSWTRYDDGSQSESGTGSHVVGASGSFRDWVAQQVRRQMTPRPEDDSAGYIHFADDGTLVATHGIEILDQVLDPETPEGFAPQGARVAAALLREPDGKRFFVLLVETEGSLETNAEPMRMGGRNLEEFLERVRQGHFDVEEVS